VVLAATVEHQPAAVIPLAVAALVVAAVGGAYISYTIISPFRLVAPSMRLQAPKVPAEVAAAAAQLAAPELQERVGPY
jgi:hypothetical protein